MVNTEAVKAAVSGGCLVGYGVALHDYAHQVWQLKGFHNPIEGGYIGFLMMLPYMWGVGKVFVGNVKILLR